MNKQEEMLKKADLIKKYSNKPIPKFLKFIGKIRELDQYEDYTKESKVAILNWVIQYIIIIPFIFFLCLTALTFKTTPNMILKDFFWAEGISILWYLFISLIKDMRGAIKNG